MEQRLGEVVTLFCYLSDKDLFADIYRNQMAKRLLQQRSASSDSERAMISMLKMKCGAQFTSKLEGMMNDLAMGRDHEAAFQSHLMQKETEGISLSEFRVQVLTTGYWPSYREMELQLPPILQQGVEVFTKYYKATTDHRKLRWAHSLGSAVVRASYERKSYELSLTTLQAVVLLLIDDAVDATMTLEGVQQCMGTDLEVVKRTLHSLSCGKFKLLLKSPEGKKISEGDSFSVNVGFKCKVKKLRVPMPSLEETHNPERITEDRSLAIEAAIVRIMKARQVLSHNQLMTEVLQILQFFRPPPRLVKKRINHLIDREYLERDEKEANVYRYLA